MSGDVAVVCTYCKHGPSEHGDYGCSHRMSVFLCGCSWTRRQLLELDDEPSTPALAPESPVGGRND